MQLFVLSVVFLLLLASWNFVCIKKTLLFRIFFFLFFLNKSIFIQGTFKS